MHNKQFSQETQDFMYELFVTAVERAISNGAYNHKQTDIIDTEHEVKDQIDTFDLEMNIPGGSAGKEKAESLSRYPASLTIAQLAESQGVCIKTARNWCLIIDDPIPSYKVGNVRRIRKESILDWIERREQL
ncbi:helix-turn-helix domain-containing protein [Paenibacillus sp. FA6]|uniref:helix-turn-helix domain-containing protein n=1 Tax=Paenibacillus sp. FA6 TaxID=3413029 RepID=UPI003F654A1A